MEMNEKCRNSEIREKAVKLAKRREKRRQQCCKRRVRSEKLPSKNAERKDE